MPQARDHRPIGFWLKLVDRLIDDLWVQTLAAEDVTRRQWQLLNLLDGGPTPLHDLDDALRPFLDAREPDVASALHGLVDRGWATDDGQVASLTDQGRTALTRLAGLVAGLRERLSRDVDPADYTTTVGTLEKMARNLGWGS